MCLSTLTFATVSGDAQMSGSSTMYTKVKIGVFSDVHGNLPALKQVIAKLDSEGCGEIYCLGDTIDIGPYPLETLDYLSTHNNIHYILGNHELYFLNGVPKGVYGQFEYFGISAHVNWTSNQIEEKYHSTIASWPLEMRTQINGVNLYFVHWPLLPSDADYPYQKVIANPTPAQLDKMFENVESDIIIYGHNHRASSLTSSGKLYVNPGSAGVSKSTQVSCSVITFNENSSYDIQTFQIEYPKEAVLKGLMVKQSPGWRLLWDQYYN